MATDQQWAAFFTGQYSLMVDGSPGAAANLNFTVRSPGVLNCAVHSGFWNDVGTLYLRLTNGPVPGNPSVPGGHIWGMMSHHSYGSLEFLFQTWELIQGPDGAWVLGFSPTGQNVVIRFQSISHDHSLQFNSGGAKQRPDSNYPWNV